MQIKKKIIKMMALLLLLALIVGCGEAKTPPPEEAPNVPEKVTTTPEAAALLYCTAAVKANFKEAERIGLTRELQASLTKAHQERLRQGAIAIWKSWGIRDIEAAEQDAKSMERSMEGIKQINCHIDIKTALVSQEENNAVVKISVRTIDGDRFYKGIVVPKLQSVAYTRLTDEAERVRTIALTFSRMGSRIEPVMEPVSFEAQFVYNEEIGYWQPADDAFGEKLARAASW